ncbi:MAG: phosphoribosylformylglycinamidine synthase subunit PurL [Saprospiraceae bacterium]
MSATPATAPAVDVSVAESLGLTSEEFDVICKEMGRTPNFTELSIFSVMWSEHCSYKNSINLLKTLPRDGEKLLVDAGEENAGLVDIGNGYACCFKIESHNHPSAIEPFQGAATGVGGIHRDIFTMGARPIAALNSLRFGDLSLPHTRKLVDGVVSGISHYGNCFGVPMVGGEVYFDEVYNQNPLVNAMSAGVVKVGETVSAAADGPGNPVFIVGSATGKDGIHGASFASKDLTEESAEDLPAVQVGDPFQEKLLLEASLEVIATGAVAGMQDMGAAGITCSSSEMSAKSETGMKINLDLVPTRQANMVPFEILLSESQERMLVVAHKGREQEILDVFDKWDLECEQIGEVTETGNVEFWWRGDKVAEINADLLVLGGGAPVYTRETKRPTYMDEVAKFSIDNITEPDAKGIQEAAHKLSADPTIASKNWITDQYDRMVRTNTATTNMPCDAAVVRVKETGSALVLTTDCNSQYVHSDPHTGAMIAVAEAARNITCAGGSPLAVTNCLNFGNPYNPEAYFQFSEAVRGMGDACRAFNTPVTGGNVSFYNQSVFPDRTEPVYPTPTIGMLGEINDMTRITTSAFAKTGDTIYLLGTSRNDIGSSRYARVVHGVKESNCPHFDLDEALALNKVVSSVIEHKLANSVHDCSEGGLFISLLESAMYNNLGFDVAAAPAGIRTDAYLYGESQSRVIVSVSPANAEAFENLVNNSGFAMSKLGNVTEGSITVGENVFGNTSDFVPAYETTLATRLQGE